jgi:hypothetical protein
MATWPPDTFGSTVLSEGYIPIPPSWEGGKLMKGVFWVAEPPKKHPYVEGV